jgi:phosphatidylglycerophosphatase A
MKAIYKFLASGLGSGYVPFAPGTAGALVGSLLLWGLHFLWPEKLSGQAIQGQWILPLLSVIIFFTGVVASNALEPEWGHDASKIVIDEIVGVWVAMWFVPFSIQNLALAFILFRVFDIWKPLFIRKMERLKGGWGIMLDDVLAGVFANLILQLISRW